MLSKIPTIGQLALLSLWVAGASVWGQAVDCSVAPNTVTACSATSSGAITFAENYSGPAAPYPSSVTLANLSGTVASVQLTLNGLNPGPNSCPSDLDLLLVNAGTGHAFVPMANFGGCASKGGSVSFTLADSGTVVSPAALASSTAATTFAPASQTKAQFPNWSCGSGTDLVPCGSAIAPGPAPATPPASAYAAGDGNATFATGSGAIFLGDNPNQTWYLYVFRNQDGSAGNSGSLASWTLSITTALTANGPAATTTAVTSSQNPSFTAAPNNSVTFTAQVTQSGGGSVTAGTLTFLDGSTVLQANIALDTNGQATFTTTALSEGLHSITAQYNGSTGNFTTSSATITQEVDTHTTNPAAGQYCNPGGLTLPASGAASVYPSNIFVSNLAGSVSSVSITLNGLSDPNLYGVNGLLTGPAVAPSPGNLVFLSNVGPAGTAVSAATYTFADGNAAFPTGSVPASGLFAPTSEPVQTEPVFPAPAPATLQFSAPANSGTLGLNGTFVNANPNGEWSLYTYVAGGGTAGTVGGWCLNITTNPPVLSVGMTGPNSASQGQTGVQYTITVTNNGPGSTAGPITVTELPSAGLSVTGMSGTGWDCSALPVCTSSTPIPANGTSQIVATVSVAANATSPQTNSASVAGGGSTGTVTVPSPLSIAILEPTTTVASNESATFSPQAQFVALFATVSSPAGVVSSGTVTFTILSNGTVIGAPTTSFTVSNGSAFANYSLPAGAQPGTYTIQAVYSGTSTLASSSDSSHTLTVSVGTTTTATNIGTSYSANAQNVTLLANVSSPAGLVTTGTVTFTVLNGSGVTVGTAVTAPVNNGTASGVYVLPAGTPVGVYTIQAVYNGSGSFGSSSDTSHTLSVEVATSTVASNVTTTTSAQPQNVTLTAVVSSSAGPVTGGTVTFTVLNNGSVIGTPVTSSALTNGVASVPYQLPGGTPAGTYTIQAVYSGTAQIAGSKDSSHTLTVGVATTTTAISISTPYSATAQNVTLYANVTSTGGVVNAGTVTFTILNNGAAVGAPVTSATLTNGTATAVYSLPGGTAIGTYTIQAVYNAAGGFAGSSDTSQTLTITAGTTTTASNALAPFSQNAQNVTLSATVTSVGGGTVNGGTVKFTLFNNGTVIGTPVVSNPVANGAATATYVLPAGSPVGTYMIQAVYSGTPTFGPSGDNTHTLTVGVGTLITAVNTAVNFSSSNQNVPLVATVTSTSGPVNGGTVTFTILNNGTTVGTPVTSGPVANGNASANYVLPGGTPVGTYVIQAVYSGSGDLTASSDNSHTLTVLGGTTVTASSVSLQFSSSPQNVTLSATLTNTLGVVNGGTVTFTVLNNGTTLGSPVTSGTVANGLASATYVLPGGTPVGVYTIQAVYSGSGSFGPGGDNSHTLSVGGATSVVASSTSAPLSAGTQVVQLSAYVTASGSPISVGTVTFTVLNNGVAVGTPVTSNGGTNGTFTVQYTLPAGTPAGVYTIQANYNGSGSYAPSSDNTHTLTIVAPTVLAATNAMTGFSETAQNVNLSATVTSVAGPVNGGTVSFTILNNGTQIGSTATSGPVVNGNASATYSLPGGTSTGTYTIQAVYSGGGIFSASGDNTHTLTVTVSTTTTASNVWAVFSSNVQSVNLSASVTSAAGIVNGGTVTFTILSNGTTIGTPVAATVSNGTVTAAYVLPAATPSGMYTIEAAYSGNGQVGASSDTTHVLTINSAVGALTFVPINPCRVVDTRNANGPFGGPELAAGSTRNFAILNSNCGIPAGAAAYSLNVTVVPNGPLGYLTIWPQGGSQPEVSTLNSDGRVKANAAIVAAGTGGGVSVYVTDSTQFVLDIDGYFIPAANANSALAFYPVSPCRITDTRQTGKTFGAGSTESFAIAGSCNIPASAQAYSLNFTAVPKASLQYLTTWPTGQPQPLASTLNAPTGTYTANAAIVPAGTNGNVSAYASDATDLVIDVDGYFAPPGTAGLALYTVTPCRVLDTRNPPGSQPFNGTIAVNVAGSSCNVPSTAQAYVLNATVVPPGPLTYLTLWPNGQSTPLVSTLNALDGAITSNLAIVSTTNGSIDAFGSNPTQLILDTSGYFAP